MWLEATKSTTPWRVSVNQLKTWHKCQRRYELHHLRQLQWPSDPSNFAYGQAVHTLMDYQARELDCAPLLSVASIQVQQAWQWLLADDTCHWPVIASEWGFTVPAPNHPLLKSAVLVGRMDRISRGPDGAVVLIDWKTGTAVPKDPMNDWQTRVYLYALAEALCQLGLEDTPLEAIKFRYVAVKNGIRHTDVAYSEAFHEETRERLIETLVAMATATRYLLPEACPDRYCGYRNVCGIEQRSSSDEPQGLESTHTKASISSQPRAE
jgi:hypothetical protein